MATNLLFTNNVHGKPIEIATSDREIFVSSFFALSLQLNPEQDGANLDSPDLDILLLNTVIDNIRGMSAAVQKTMLKSIITSLLDHSKPLYRYL
jgi:hypothetical protein